MKQVILGVDPGSRHTGFGVLEGEQGRLIHLASGSIQAGTRPPLESRLCRIFDGLSEILQQHRPQAVALEEIFLASNVHSAFTLGQVRGVVLLLAAQAGLPIFYYSPLVIKKAVVGYGRASKEQVELMVRQMLGVTPANEHAADALAVGMCHFFHSRWPAPPS